VKEEREFCINCGVQVIFSLVTQCEWAHVHGDRYCHDRQGFTVMPLTVAQPPFHSTGDVL
jgi:hypothetical protein